MEAAHEYESDELHGNHCLVTGATGYIGRGLVEVLLRHGAGVTAVARQTRPGSFAAEIEYKRHDLTLPAQDPGSALDLEGVDQVFHLAGIAHQNAAPGDYARSNVVATERLAEAAAAAGVRRFVFVSSVKALTRDPDKAHKSASVSMETLDYGESKALAEQRLRSICAEAPMELALLRPALVYSPDAPGHLASLRKWAAVGLPAPPPGGGRSMIARDDLLRLCIAIARRPALSGVLEVTATDGEAYSARRMHAALCSLAGREPRLPSPPAWCWRLAAQTLDLMRGQAPGTTWSRLTDTELAEASGYEAVGFEPRLTFERAMRGDGT